MSGDELRSEVSNCNVALVSAERDWPLGTRKSAIDGSTTGIACTPVSGTDVSFREGRRHNCSEQMVLGLVASNTELLGVDRHGIRARRRRETDCDSRSAPADKRYQGRLART